ncbi:MAG TPA: hypothetical protein VGO67_26030 [Verrucomicrobiae bacterium]|jgi:hypothetical protein
MITFLSALMVLGLLIWAVRMKKYYQAFLALVTLLSISACIVGISEVHFGRDLPGSVLIAVGLGSLLWIGAAVKRLYFCAK